MLSVDQFKEIEMCYWIMGLDFGKYLNRTIAFKTEQEVNL